MEVGNSMIAEAEKSIDRVLEFWRGHQVGGGIPAKTGLRLTEVKRELRYFTINEREAPDRFVYRLHGSGMAALARADLTGTDLIDTTPEIWQEPVLKILNIILDQPCGVRERHTAQDPVAGVVERLGLHLPLATDDGTPLYILNYYPPTSSRDDPPFSATLRSDVMRQPIAVVDLELIDLGAGLPPFADELKRTVRQIAEQVGDVPPA